MKILLTISFTSMIEPLLGKDTRTSDFYRAGQRNKGQSNGNKPQKRMGGFGNSTCKSFLFLLLSFNLKLFKLFFFYLKLDQIVHQLAVGEVKKPFKMHPF